MTVSQTTEDVRFMDAQTFEQNTGCCRQIFHLDSYQAEEEEFNQHYEKEIQNILEHIGEVA
jgi:hypothetical protein